VESDYPAAHSMDTDWFAVDRDGRVAYFNSGENGPVPESLRDDADIEGLVNHLRAGAGQPPLPEDEWYLEREDEYLASHGIFVFTHPNVSEWVEPYARSAEPEQPLHVDQLPPGFRDAFRRVQLPVSFAEVTGLQPCEFVACIYWGYPAGYLCGDGKTLRPFPGREEEFRQSWEDYRRRSWRRSRGLRLADGEDPPGEDLPG
jgi:hypothetical protein